jgi:phage terminase large subunit-like protein
MVVREGYSRHRRAQHDINVLEQRQPARPQPSLRRLTWPNGTIATTFSAEEPERLRGPQHDTAWCDEAAAWKHPEAFDMLAFGMRLGADPRVLVTTTPRPVKLVRVVALLAAFGLLQTQFSKAWLAVSMA